MDIIRTPPPWKLKGNGYILIYQFPKSFVHDNGLIPPFLEGKFIGGHGAVIMVDYQASDVGPYRELLFIPGMFKYGQHTVFSITHIYVSTERSVVNGRRNWSIPKYQADFSIELQSANCERFSASKDDQPFFDITMQSSPLRLPVMTRLNPLSASLIQHYEGRTHITTPGASGWVGMAQVKSLKIDGSRFPDVSKLTPKVVLRAHNVTLQFPLPKVVAEAVQYGN